MKGCDYDRLVRFIDKKLGLDEKLEVFDHLDRCRFCRETVYMISRERDSALFVNYPGREEKHVA